MPTKPKRPCNQPGCRELTDQLYCAKHKRETTRRSDSERGTAAKRGYNARWQKARITYLSENPLCVQCSAPTPATVVDHIIPHRGDRELFWDTGNWQALCKRCHDRKTAKGK